MEPAVDVLGKTRNFHGGVRSLGGGYVTAYSALSSPRFARSPENTERRQSPPPRGLPPNPPPPRRAAARVSDGRGTHACHASHDRGIFRTARSFSLRPDASSVTPPPPPARSAVPGRPPAQLMGYTLAYRFTGSASAKEGCESCGHSQLSQ